MTHRPCGECRELVPADTGCEHWRPGRSPKRHQPSRRTRAAGRAATVADFQRIVGRSYR